MQIKHWRSIRSCDFYDLPNNSIDFFGYNSYFVPVALADEPRKKNCGLLIPIGMPCSRGGGGEDPKTKSDVFSTLPLDGTITKFNLFH